MSDQLAVGRRPALLYVGLITIALGAVIAFVAKSMAEREARIDEFAAAYGGRLVDVYPNYLGMWIGIVIAALGVVAIFVYIGTRQTNDESPRADPVAGSSSGT